MLEARIVSSRGSLFYAAAEATPYDLQSLREHLRALSTDVRDVRLEVRVDEVDAAAPGLSSWLREVAADGVRVTHVPVRVPHLCG